MSTEGQSNERIFSDRFGYFLETIWKKFGKISSNLVSNSSPMTTADKVGLVLTIIAFGFILTPIAYSEADPYHIKGLLEEIKENISLTEDFVKNQDHPQYTVIVHLKLSPETHLDTTEKIIFGKYSSITS